MLTRSMKYLCIPTGKKSISYRGASLWNEVEQIERLYPWALFAINYKSSYSHSIKFAKQISFSLAPIKFHEVWLSFFVFVSS